MADLQFRGLFVLFILSSWQDRSRKRETLPAPPPDHPLLGGYNPNVSGRGHKNVKGIPTESAVVFPGSLDSTIGEDFQVKSSPAVELPSPENPL